MQDFTGRVAVITGGAGGVGKGIARALLEEGARVVLADIEGEPLELAVKTLSAHGDVSGFTTDVLSPESLEHLADHVFTSYGGCQLLFNNAGVSNGDALAWRTTPNDWKWVFGVNVFGVAHGIIAFVPRMIASGEEGHIVNTSSGNGGYTVLARAGVYAASKSAVSALTEGLANQLIFENTKLRASVLYPSGGLLRTGLLTSERNRHAELTREREREYPEKDWDTVKAEMESGGFTMADMDLDELGRVVVAGIRDGKFVLGVNSEGSAQGLIQRAQTLAKAELPVSRP
jgi:NAD(P)-dependent dehydrogenase (short-subunit alcohol dehydrogenase family)